MTAVVELAMVAVFADVWHAGRQLRRAYVVQAKFLKARRIHERGAVLGVHPIPSGRSGGVFA